jgi:hypothetical protein
MEECSTCRYFLRGAVALQGQRYGECARFPQRVSKHDTEGCGEHRPVSETPLKEPARKPPPK